MLGGMAKSIAKLVALMTPCAIRRMRPELGQAFGDRRAFERGPETDLSERRRVA
jgi:hypothetical protein